MKEFIKCVGVCVLGAGTVMSIYADPASAVFVMPIFGVFVIIVSRRDL